MYKNTDLPGVVLRDNPFSVGEVRTVGAINRFATWGHFKPFLRVNLAKNFNLFCKVPT